MTFTTEMIGAIKQLMPAAQERHAVGLVQDAQEQKRKVKHFTDQIPWLIARAYAAGKDFVEFSDTIRDIEGNDRDRGYCLYFCLGGWKSRYVATEPKPEYLVGTAKLVWEYCVENDLRPKLLPFFKLYPDDRNSRLGCRMIIRWQPEYLQKLLTTATSATPAQKFYNECCDRLCREYNGKNSVMVSFANPAPRYSDEVVCDVAARLQAEGRKVSISTFAIYISEGPIMPGHARYHEARVARFRNKCWRKVATEGGKGSRVMVSFCEHGVPEEQYTDDVVNDTVAILRKWEKWEITVSTCALYIDVEPKS